MSKVIVFCFAGRRANMELQLPLMRRVLAEHPEVEYHVWNLARDHDDNLYLRTIEGERITVINDLYGVEPWKRFNEVYQHYANETYAHHLFVKIDDDVVFLETARFGAFVDMVKANRDAVVTAKVVNNGACTASEPGLWQVFSDLRVPLLDVHLNPRYAWHSHHYFFDHWPEMLGQPVEARPLDDWLSINFIGYDWPMARRMAELIGTPSPRRIAGRAFAANARLGDEGMVNTLPRVMCQGFVACHLYFGPQAKRFPVRQLAELYQGYTEIGEKYLAAP